MLRHKKAVIDDFMESVVALVVMAFIVLWFHSSVQAKQLKMNEEVSGLKQKSYANSILVEHYLDDDLSMCYSFTSNPAAENLRAKGLLNYADLINMVIKGRPKESLFESNFKSKVLVPDGKKEYIDDFFQETSEPYGQYTLIWQECTDQHFRDIGFTTPDIKYTISTSFNHGANSISYSESYLASGYTAALIGQADIPDYSDRKDTIHVTLYELKKE